MFASLPWRWIGIGFAGLALIVAAVFGVRSILNQARKDGAAEVTARWEAEKRGAAEESAKLTAELTEALGGIDGKLQTVIAKIHEQGRVIKIETIKEIESDPRYSSDDCSVTDGVLRNINAARGLSGNPASSGVSGKPVPTGNAVVRFQLGDTGSR